MGAASGTEAACGLHGDQQEIRQVCSYKQTMLHTYCQLSCTVVRMKFSTAGHTASTDGTWLFTNKDLGKRLRD